MSYEYNASDVDELVTAFTLIDDGDSFAMGDLMAVLEAIIDNQSLHRHKALKLGAAGGQTRLHVTSASVTPVAVPSTTNFILVDDDLDENKTLVLPAGTDGDEVYYFRRGVSHAFACIITDAAGTICQDDSGNTNQTWARLRYFDEEMGIVDAGWYVIAHGPALGDFTSIRDIAWTV